MTIIDVAEKAGVSHTTVSNVINNHSGVSPETAERVWRVIRETGYELRPREQRRGPRGRRKKSAERTRIGLVWYESPVSGANHIASQMLDGVAEMAERRQAEVSVFRSEAGMERLAKSLGDMAACEGYLIQGNVTPENAAPLADCPTILLFSSGSLPWADRVRPDHERIGKEAFEYLQGFGRASIFMVMGSSGGSPAYTLRSRAFLDGAGRAGYSVKTLSFDPDQTDRVDVRATARSLAEAKEGGVGVFFVRDWLAPAVYSALQEIGCPPGDWMRSVGCNNTPFVLEGLHPRPATFDINARLVGKIAVERLLWRIHNPELDKGMVTLVPPRLMRS